MSEQNHNDWKSPVTFDICHHYACYCPCCDGTGPTAEYSLVMIPSHLRNMMRTVPVLRLYEDELESLMNLVSDALMGRTNVPAACSKTDGETCKDGEEEESLSFGLTRNENGQLGECSLHIMGRRVDDLLPVDKEELQTLLEHVAEMKQYYDARLRRLAEGKNREREAKSRMKGKTLDEIEDEVRGVNPFVGKDEQDSQVVRVLLATAFFVGSDADRIVSFTGYSRNFVAGISCRMHDSGLWAEGEACVEHWFDEQLKWSKFGLVQDCIVADGFMVARRGGEHETWSYQDSGRSW